MDNIKFDQIKGYKEEKKELINLCYLIKNRDELKKRGGKLPKGVLLLGPNGVGKTVLANAFLKESACNSVIISYNDLEDDNNFTEYIKEKFLEASKLAPCIIFIDEIDKLIGTSSRFFMEDNFDKSRFLLNEMNKYKDVDGLFILACGNKELDIDYSIVRSGRIDKIIQIGLPKQYERLEILKYYTKGKAVSSNVNLNSIAKLTLRFSGADIEALVNNALIRSFTDHRSEISNDDLVNEYYEKVFSSKSKQPDLEDSSLRSVAVHEAGHCVANLLLDKEGVSCVTVLSRENIRGFSAPVRDERKVRSLEDSKNSIVIGLSGLVAEEIILGFRNDGAKLDIRDCRLTARQLIRNDGYLGLEFTDQSFFNHKEMDGPMIISRPPNEMSLGRLEKLEELENKLIDDCYKEANKLIKDNIKLVNAIVDNLLVKMVLSKEDIDEIVNSLK